MILCTFPISAQEVRFEQSFHIINSENGLLSSEVYRVGQDSKGRVWICTDAGVTKYDGYYFKTYTIKDGLVDNVVFDFYEDDLGRIWFLSYNSLLCYIENNVIKKYKYNNLIKKKIGSTTVSEKVVYVDDSLNVYYAMRYFGLLKITPSGQMTQLHKDTNTLEVNRLGDRYVASFLFDRIHAPHRLIKHCPNIKDKKMVFEEDLNRIWACTVNVNNKERAYLLVQDQIYDTYTDEIVFEGRGILRMGQSKDGKFWIGTIDGLLIGHISASGKFVKENEYLKGSSITNLYMDHENGYWISSLNNGVYYTPSFTIEMTDLNKGLMNKNIVDITIHKGDVWASFIQGWQNLNTGDKYFPESSSYSKLISTGKELVISDRRNRGLKFTNDEIHVPYASDFYVNENGEVFMSSSSVVKFSRNDPYMDTIYSCTFDFSARRQNIFSTILCGPDGRVYVGSQSGLFYIDNKSRLQYYPDSISASSFAVSDIAYHSNWGMVIATSYRGVFIIKNGRITHNYNADNGLSDNKINCIEFDRVGNLVIGTNSGLNIVYEESRAITRVGRNQGLQSGEVTSLAMGNEYMYVGTKNGLFRIKTHSLRPVKSSAENRVYLKSVYADREQLNLSGNFLELPDGIESLRIQFRNNNFRNWHNKSYQYRLSEGGEWVDISSPEIVIFNPSGQFRIQVRYLNDRDEWSDVYEVLSVETLVPFYKQWYFWFMSTILVALIMFLGYRRRQNQIRTRLKIENEMLSLEQRMQQVRMNPHFILNILNSVHTCLQQGKNDMATMYLTKFSGHMRSVMISVGSSSISMENEIEILKKYLELEQLRNNDSFDFEIICRDIDRSIEIPSIIVQPFVENAILHGVRNNVKSRGKVRVEFYSPEPEQVQIIITDNGESTLDNPTDLIKVKASHAIEITEIRLEKYNRIKNTDSFGIETMRTGGDEPETRIVITVPVIVPEKRL